MEMKYRSKSIGNPVKISMKHRWKSIRNPVETSTNFRWKAIGNQVDIQQKYQQNAYKNPFGNQLKFQLISNGNCNDIPLLSIGNQFGISLKYLWKSFGNLVETSMILMEIKPFFSLTGVPYWAVSGKMGYPKNVNNKKKKKVETRKNVKKLI